MAAVLLWMAVASAPAGGAGAHVTGLARKHLATRLKNAGAPIETLAVQPTTWPDSSLGCPQRGRQYLQMLTPGYCIDLRAEGRIWTYHSDTKRVIPCGGPCAGRGKRRLPIAPPPDNAPVEK